MSLIQISNLTFGYDGSADMIFERVSFQMDTDWKLGFTGRNGCGKTTFLRLLLGQLEYTGSISASVEFDYFPFLVSDKSRNTIDIAHEIDPDFEQWQLQKELCLMDVCLDVLYRPFETLSNGEQTKVLLAMLFLKQNNFLLIDEPTNHLDQASRRTVGAYLKGKKGFILVSHDRAFLDSCIDHILSVNKTDIEIQSGNFSTWMQNKERRDAFELDQNEQLKKEIRRFNETARQKAGWSDQVEKTKKGTRVAGLRPDRGAIGHKAAKMMKRAKTAETRAQKAAEEKAKLLKNLEQSDELKLQPLSYHTERLAELKEVSIFYGERTICREVDFVVNQGDRISLSGKNGCGKSSILKLLCGDSIPHNGMLYLAKNITISYVPQDASFLSGSLDTLIREHGLDRTLLLTLLRKLGFLRSQFDKGMEQFSQGQKKKVLLAKSLCERAHLYIWDEPLNFVDVISRMQVEQMIQTSDATMIFVEHDQRCEANIATKIVTL